MSWSIRASRLPARLVWIFSFLIGAALLDLASVKEWPGPGLPVGQIDSAEQALIRSQRLCVLNTKDSAGEIGRKVVFRWQREGSQLKVSYFVHWSTERPWGDRSMMASLAIDSVYSHLFFVLPGLRYLMHGPGDVEGATVVYRVVDDHLEVLEGFADDESHDPVRLLADELTDGKLTDGKRETVLMTSVWSHQLGAHSAAQAAAGELGKLARNHCYEGADLVPLTPAIADRFWLGSADAPLRARPAWR
jgi:hypothetical protein